MIRTIVIVLLFFAAVAISPILIGEKGYILIAMGDLTIESTVVTATMMLVVLFIALLLTLKVLRGGISLGKGTWHKFSFASKRRGQRTFNKGIAAYLMADYAQAEKLLAKSAEPADQQQAAYLIAAHAAHIQHNAANSGHYLQLLQHHGLSVKEAGIESILVQIKILLEQQEIPTARTLIDDYHRHLGHDARLLGFEIDLCLLEKRFEAAIEYLPKAAKQKTLSNQRIEQWHFDAYYGQFKYLVIEKSTQALTQYWQGLARKIKLSDAVVLAYCQILAEENIYQDLNAILLPVIKKGANSKLLHALKTLPLNKPDELISAVQKHLYKDKENTLWLVILGHLAVANKDWALAERAFLTVYSKDITQVEPLDTIAYAKALNGQGKHQEAAELLITATQ